MGKTRLGTVHWVGMGTAGHNHLTLRAVELLGCADTIVVDLPPDTKVVSLVSESAEWIVVGAVQDRPALAAAEVLDLLKKRAKGGRRVVRVVEGDPTWFEATVNDARELERAGLNVELVPGITSLQAACAGAGLPLTKPSEPQSVVCVSASKADPAPWGGVLLSGATLVLFDPLPRLRQWVGALLAAGVAPGFPCVVVQRAGMPGQVRIHCGLEELPTAADRLTDIGPALVLIGDAVRERDSLTTPERRPLSGRRLVLTRTRDQSSEWRARLENLGAEVIELPLIQVILESPKETAAEVLAELGTYDWIVFTSANGVRGFFKLFFAANKDIRALGIARLAVVGEATAAALRSLNLEPEIVPGEQDADGLAKALVATDSLENAKVLVVTGNLNREDLVKSLGDARAIVDRLPVYRTEKSDLAREPGAVDFRRRGADALLFTSSSAVRSFVEQAGSLAIEPDARRPLAASIGAMTSATMREFRLPVDVEAAEPSLDSLVAGLQRAFDARNQPGS